jgi:hypothetical protein
MREIVVDTETTGLDPLPRSEQVRLDHFGARVVRKQRKQSVNDICDGIEGKLPRCRDSGLFDVHVIEKRPRPV